MCEYHVQESFLSLLREFTQTTNDQKIIPGSKTNREILIKLFLTLQ